MSTLPSAVVTISEDAGAPAGGDDLLCVLAPVATNADVTPRQYGNAADVVAQHGFNEGAEYVAFHAEQTRQPVLFVGIPVVTAGVISRENTGGNTGTSVSSIAAGGDGCLSEHDGVLTVGVGGTIGTPGIFLDFSLDGGRTTRRARLGTASSYVLPLVSVTASFAAGTLVAGDVIHTWHGSGPLGDASGWALARVALGAQAKQFRNILLIGDLQDSTEAAAYLAQLDAYKSVNQRAIFGRSSVLDRLPLAALSSTTHRMTGSPTITFAEVGATGDTITRSSGSFVSDGFAAGDMLTVAGSASNNATHAAKVAIVSALVLTLDTDDLTPEGPVSGVSIVGRHSLTFADSDDTVTRSGGSWLADGFRKDDVVTVATSAANDGTFTITAVSALVLTFETDDLADEVLGSTVPTIAAGQTKAAWMAALESAFAPVDAAERITMSAGRARKLSPLSGWWFRRPIAWQASLREYLHDLHIPTWMKKHGPTGWSLLDATGNLAEWDDFVDGAAGVAARFTVARSFNNPVGAFTARDLTRATDGSLLGNTQIMAVVNKADNVCQYATENLIGELGEREPGSKYATKGFLSMAAATVNEALAEALLGNLKNEGARANGAEWTPSATDDMSVAEPTLTGVLEVSVKNAVVTILTSVRVS
jgi:hypothetical protein